MLAKGVVGHPHQYSHGTSSMFEKRATRVPLKKTLIERSGERNATQYNNKFTL